VLPERGLPIVNRSDVVSGQTPGGGARDQVGARGRPLATYFALLVAVFVAAAGAAVAYVEVQTRRDARSAARDDTRAAVEAASRELERGVAVLRATVDNLAASPSTASALDRPAGCTLTISFGDLGGGHLDIVSRKGKVVCTSLPAPDGGRRPDYAGADWLARALAGRRLDAPVLDTATGERVALVSAPLAGRRGVVAGFVELAPLARSLARLQGGGSSLAFLVASADGKTVLARSVEPDRSIGAALAGTGFARSRPSGEWRDLDGTKRIYSSAAIPSTGWRLYVGEESGAALAAAVRLERRELGIIAAGLAAFLLATWVIYRRTARPIKELAAGVRSASSEAGSESAPVRGHGPAEVRALAEDVNGLLATVRSELAERRRVEEDLRVSEESYRLLFEKHPAPMWLFDPETLRFLAVNDAAVAAYGYSKEEFLALTLDDIRPEQDRGVLRREPPDLGRRDEGSLWRHRKKDGTVIEVMVVADTVEFEGRPVRVVLAQDVTEQRRLEEQLRQSQKMEAIGSLAGGIAHDFNNLLTVIRGYSSVLRRQVQGDDLRAELEQIDDAAGRAGELTRQLLAFSRQQVLRPDRIQVNDVVEETLKLLNRVIGENIEIECELAPDLVPVFIDRGQLGQVILNLAVNARDAMPDGGKLWIRTSNVEIDPRYAAEHVDVEPGPHVLLQVTDSGVGMDEATRERVFDPYFTTKPHGTGFGLSTVYGIVRQSGGHIWLYTEPGTGTTFKLYFPQATEAAAPVAAPPPPAAVASLQGSETVLLVEDDDAVRALAVDVLRSLGYRVLEARTPAEAIVAAESPERVDVMLTDVVLPEMNGAELAERVLERRPGLRLLFTSGYPGGTLVRGQVAGARVAFIEKPYLPAELARALREVLDGGDGR